MQKLGQHFLTNHRILEKIAAAICIKPEETIIEIGPGHGELTKLLASKLLAFRIIAVEKDKNLVKFLNNKFKKNISDEQIKIVEGDALKLLSNLTTHYSLLTTHYKIVGNIPYYITGHLLRIIGELENKPELIVLTIQKEVAERIIGQSPKMNPVRGRPAEGATMTALGRSASNGMNLLAASVQFWAEPEIIGFIPRKDFQPMPKVDSAIIKLTPKKRIENEKWRMEKNRFYKLIKALFKQPRKTILNNLREGGLNQEKIKEICEKLEINPSLRPQNLTIKQLLTLSTALN